jgi:hypothetical protein
VIAQLFGQITITVELGAVLPEPGLEGFDPSDRGGKAGITAADVPVLVAHLRELEPNPIVSEGNGATP